MQTTAYNAFIKGDSVILLSRDEKGRRVARSVPADYSAFFKAADISEDLLRDLKKSQFVKSIKREAEWLRVGFVSSDARRDFCQGSKSFVGHLGIKTFESDVHPVMRHVVDNKVAIQRARRCYLDIETDSRVPFSRKEEMRVLSWCIVDEQGNVHVGVLEENTDRAERALLARLWDVLALFDQVCAWNGDGFDFPVIMSRSEQRGLDQNPAEWLWLDHMVVFESMNKNASDSGEEKRSMKLGDIGQVIVGEGKEVTPPHVVERFGDKSLGALAWQLWEAGGEMRDVLVSYMIQDTELLRKIEKETGYIDLLGTLCEVCNVFGDTRGLNPTNQMDGFMLRLAVTRGQHFAAREYREVLTKFKGAYVMDPKSSGILRDVHVVDFKSLYPSIIVTWNMSPDTKVIPDKASEGTVARSPLTNIFFDTKKRGILPEAIAELLRLREHWSDLQASFPPGTDEAQNAKRKSNAYKVAANSFFGAMGSPFSRFFDRQIAESITQNGAWLILETIKEVEKRGWEAVYGDTDSVFVRYAKQDEFEAFVDWCNKDFYPRILKEVGCKENTIKLAYEKQFDRLVFTAAKKYVGSYVHYKKKKATADSKPEIKGLEFKRGDSLVLASNLQAHVIDLLVGGLKIAPHAPSEDIADYHEILSKVRDHILKGDLPLPEIRQSKSLSKSLKDYAVKKKMDGTDAAQPIHVTIAKILDKRGEEVREGTRIEYVVTDGASSPMKAIPASDYKGEVDRFYIWENAVFPGTKRLLEAAFPDLDWDVWHKVRPAKVRQPRKPRAIKGAEEPHAKKKRSNDVGESADADE